MNNKGIFITFEGGEGCGKSTQIKKLQEYLTAQNIDFISAREPGGTPVGEQIRELLLHYNENMNEKTEALLFSAARSEIAEKVIVPALNQNKLVICDRFYDSFIVYQGVARQLGEDNVRQITKFAIEDLKPDCTIYLKLSPEKGFERKGGVDTSDKIEMAGLAFHQKVFEAFNNLAVKEPNRFLVIDASLSVEEVFNNILLGLKSRGINL